MKVQESIKAKELRKKGYSLGEISRELKISKSTVSVWVKDIKLDDKAREILNDKIHKSQRVFIENNILKGKLKNMEAEIFAQNIVKNSRIQINEKLIICALIYWCEGSKDRNFAFMNSDPELLKKFIMLLRDCFIIDEKKFRVCVHLHGYHDKEKQLKFWSKTLRIPLNQFIKPFIKFNNKIHIRENYQGCASLRYHDSLVARNLKAVAMEFIKGD